MKERLSVDGARVAIKTRAQAAGMDGFISGHSLRVGSAISLAEAGASVVEMQVAGRWKSPQMPAYYAKAEFGSPRRDCTIEIQAMKQGGRSRFWVGGRTVRYK